MTTIDQLKRISDTLWELPTSFKEGMHVPVRIYATEQLIRTMDEAVYEQTSNVACLPGITKYALCMPDGHFGYGFPIGGVAAMDIDQGGVMSTESLIAVSRVEDPGWAEALQWAGAFVASFKSPEPSLSTSREAASLLE
jgi:hypothetical protein